MSDHQKIVIYQVFTRLFGAKGRANIRFGTKVQNGCGRMADFSQRALASIRQLGATHIWYTGVIEHATCTDYSAFGIRPDHPAVVKGQAGSPYAIKDYYDIDPDLAVDVSRRMDEFENLVRRTHQTGLKVIIDFVPNHVARQYHSDVCPEGVRDLGADDDKSQFFASDNNFYYVPGQQFAPSFPLTDADGNSYVEIPARATGNDCFSQSPSLTDWYETVKLNYGINPSDGSRHFSPIPSTWKKMLHILSFWAAKGVDAFRCDMAEMVPCEFWGWAIPQVKAAYPDLLFIAEVYNPNEYRHYIYDGCFDYLYDKVGLYDTLRGVMGGAAASDITHAWQAVDDISDHMLNFLENHDEQRIASDFFAGHPDKGRPAFLVSALMRSNPVMLYFGQELGERGMEAEGFSGCDGRTTIFDYWTLNTISRWRHGGQFDEALLTPAERDLRQFYQRVLTLCHEEAAIREGQFFDVMYANVGSPLMNTHRQFAFLRKKDRELILVVANFDSQGAHSGVCIPRHAFDCLSLPVHPADRKATDLLTGAALDVRLEPDVPIQLTLPAQGGLVLKFEL